MIPKPPSRLHKTLLNTLPRRRARAFIQAGHRCRSQEVEPRPGDPGGDSTAELEALDDEQLDR